MMSGEIWRHMSTCVESLFVFTRGVGIGPLEKLGFNRRKVQENSGGRGDVHA